MLLVTGVPYYYIFLVTAGLKCISCRTSRDIKGCDTGNVAGEYKEECGKYHASVADYRCEKIRVSYKLNASLETIER